MTITQYSSDNEILTELGSRIKALRIDFAISQTEMAERTGLSLRTISNLESGKDVSMTTLLEVMRVLGRLQSMENIVPEAVVRPSRYLAFGKKRERVSKVQKKAENGHKSKMRLIVSRNLRKKRW